MDAPSAPPPPVSVRPEGADGKRVVHMAHQGILEDTRRHLAHIAHALIFAIRVPDSTSNNHPRFLGHLIAFPRSVSRPYSSEALLDSPQRPTWFIEVEPPLAEIPAMHHAPVTWTIYR